MTNSTAIKVGTTLSLVLAMSIWAPTSTVDAQGKTQKISKDLIKRAEDMVKDLDKARKQADKTAKKYDEIFKKNKVKDRQKVYKDLNKEIEKTEDRVKDVRKRAENMQKEADKFFNEWSKGLTKIEDTELRGFAHENMVENRDRYTAVIESALRAGGLYDEVVTDLKSQCRYFDLDMSDTAMAKLTTNRDDTNQQVEMLLHSADELTKTTEGYIESMK